MIQTGINGIRGENLALKYLEQRGLRIIERNYYSRFGEIDLIMRDGETLVFVEARYRKSQKFGGALASVDAKKQKKLRRTAECYLQHTKSHDSPCRFDILCISGSLDKPSIDWITNAF